MIHGQGPSRGLSSTEVDGMETGSPCRVLYIGPITEDPIALLYCTALPPGASIALRISHPLSSLHHGLLSGSIIAASLRSTHYPSRSLSFCWQVPARICTLVPCAINSTDPRLPVGLWAPFASHRPLTFVVWGFRLLKNWSPSFLRPWR